MVHINVASIRLLVTCVQYDTAPVKAFHPQVPNQQLDDSVDESTDYRIISPSLISVHIVDVSPSHTNIDLYNFRCTLFVVQSLVEQPATVLHVYALFIGN